MASNKLNIHVQIGLLIFIVVIAGLLLYQSISAPDRTERINLHSKQLHISNKIAEDISNLTANSQLFILYSDKEHLNNFRYHSAKLVENELELYNISSSGNKEIIENILDLSKTYIAFMENEVVPTIQSPQRNADEIKYLQLRHNEFQQELQQRVTEINTANTNGLNSYLHATISNMNNKMALLVVAMLIALLLLMGGVYISITSLAPQHLYLKKLTEKLDSAIIVVDRNGVFRQINNFGSQLLGVHAGQLLGRSVSDIPYFFPQLQSLSQPLYTVIMGKNELLNQKITYFNGGKKTKLNVDYMPVISPKQVLTGVIIMARIIKEQQGQRALLDTLETERKRISIEIHDWIARYLSTIMHAADYILKRQTMTSQELKNNLLTVRNHCQNGAIEMRGIMNNIHPYLIDKVGLVSALESYVNIYEKLNNIKTYVFYQKRALSIPGNKEIIIYRIIQEALSNIAKHSQATEVDIHLTTQSNVLQIEIEDNGGQMGEFVPGKGMWGMKERAKLIEGDIKFEHSDTGFCVTLTVPLRTGGRQDE